MSATASARIKAASIRTRNNHIERNVSRMQPTVRPEDGGDSEAHTLWEETMTLLAEQFSQLQELLGMLS